MKNKVLIIDGNSLFFRSYYATAHNLQNMMTTSDGIYINAVYTFNVLIESAVRKLAPTHLFIAFDKGSKTKRHAKYTEYKAKRSKTPQELLNQLPIVKELLTLKKICWYECKNWEADDILATIAKRESKMNNEVMIMSSDRDLLQLVDKNISFLINVKGMSVLDIYNNTNFFEKIGIAPCQIPDYKGIAGDRSDNLPGVAGVGPKGAAKLLDKYKTLDNVYKSLDEIGGRLKEKLIASKINAFMSYELAILNQKVDIPYTNNDYVFKHIDSPELAAFYEKYEMNSFLGNLQSKPSSKYDRIIF